MKITNLDKTAKKKMDIEGAKDAWKQVPISKDDGTPVFSLRVFTIEPGGHTPYHTHPFEHVNYIIEGNGSSRDGKRGREACPEGRLRPHPS